MSTKKLVAILLILLIVVGAIYITVNPMSVLILQIGYTTLPVATATGTLRDVTFTFKVDRYFASVPGYQLMSGYQVVHGQNKLSFLGLELNFTLDISVYQGMENGTLWRSYHFVFSTVAERLIRIYCETPADVTLGNNATIVLDGRLVGWYKGEMPHINKVLHKTFTIDIPH